MAKREAKNRGAKKSRETLRNKVTLVLIVP